MIRSGNVFNGVKLVIPGTTGGGIMFKINIHTRRCIIIKGGIIIALTNQNVVAFTATHLIVAGAAKQGVIANTTINQVVTIAAIKGVIARTAMNIIMTKFAVDDVIAFVRPKRISP